MKMNGNEIRQGNIIKHLKNILDGRKLNERFRAAETVERVRLDQKPHTFLYAEGEMLVFMNSENYEQINLQSEFVGDQAVYLTDGMAVDVEFYEERAISIALANYAGDAICGA